MGIRIVAAGRYLPQRIVTNEDFTKLVDTSDEWITSRTGIKKRHFATDEFVHNMGAKAAADALKNAGITKDDIDLVVASTCTPDYITPSLSCLVANELQMNSPACIDINCACAGFVSAVDIARLYLDSGEYKRALVVSSEMLTKITDYSDRSTCVLFGDGAGAAIIEHTDSLYHCDMGSDPSGARHVFARAIGPHNPFTKEGFTPESDGFAIPKEHCFHQDGQDVYKFATRAMPNAIKEACRKAMIDPTELDWIFSHQANARILETAAKNLKLPIEKFYMNIEQRGNISSACIPVCLSEAIEKGILKRGDKMCIVGFGGGLVYAATIFEW